MATNGFKQVHELAVNVTHYPPTMEVQEVGWRIQKKELTKNGTSVVTIKINEPTYPHNNFVPGTG